MKDECVRFTESRQSIHKHPGSNFLSPESERIAAFHLGAKASHVGCKFSLNWIETDRQFKVVVGKWLLEGLQITQRLIVIMTHIIIKSLAEWETSGGFQCGLGVTAASRR